MNVNKKHKLKSKSVTVSLTKVIRDHKKNLNTSEESEEEIKSEDLDNFKFYNSAVI